MRRVTVFTATRAEYGLLKPVIRAIAAAPSLKLSVVVTGTHLLPEFGRTLDEVVNNGFPVARVIDSFSSSNEPGDLLRSVGCGIAAIAPYFEQERPDILLLLGDRYELFIPLFGALLYRVPIAHLCGGEITEGVLDEQVRHAITKMAHLHFPSTFASGRRLRQMGEEAWRIHVVGAPAIENISRGELMGPEELQVKFGIDVRKPTLLVTYHPETLLPDAEPVAQVRALITALARFSSFQQVVTCPGLEVGAAAIIRAWEEYANGNRNVRFLRSLGSRGYLGVMRHAAAVVGNSSSGIIEAPSFKVPTVNIGDRQKGRERAASVIDVPCNVEEIVAGLSRALYDEGFRAGLKQVRNPYDPYGDGNVSGRIVSVLESVPLDRRLLQKKLDLPAGEV